MKFFMPIPKSLRKSDCALVDAGKYYHTKKPDVSNLVKFAEDCLNGFAWGDDSQIVALRAMKVYGKEPRTEITLKGFVGSEGTRE